MGCGVSRAMGRRKGSLGVSVECVIHGGRKESVCSGRGVGKERYCSDEGGLVIDVT